MLNLTLLRYGLYKPEEVGAWVGYPTSRLLSPMSNPGEGGSLVCVQPYIVLVFWKLKYFYLVEFSAKLDVYCVLGLDIILIIFHSLLWWL